MNTSTNYGLKEYEGSDTFNPLAVDVPNLEKIDEVMHDNELGITGTATHVLSGTVHAIVRELPDTPMFRFLATADFTFGDSFTVDGIAYTATTPDGAQLQTGAFKIGTIVLACLEGTALTVYASGTGTAPDSERLGGELPSHYALQSDMTQAQSDIGDNADAITAINGELHNVISGTLSAGSTTVTLIDARIKVTSIYEPYMYVPTGVPTKIITPTEIAVSSGQCTLTFEPQSDAITVGIRIFG